MSLRANLDFVQSSEKVGRFILQNRVDTNRESELSLGLSSGTHSEFKKHLSHLPFIPTSGIQPPSPLKARQRDSLTLGSTRFVVSTSHLHSYLSLNLSQLRTS
ncbi:MAG: hypothetical protein Fues2KO_13630 [Fuerstiella sp.]